jgi:hypothetical protein
MPRAVFPPHRCMRAVSCIALSARAGQAPPHPPPTGPPPRATRHRRGGAVPAGTPVAAGRGARARRGPRAGRGVGRWQWPMAKLELRCDRAMGRAGGCVMVRGSCGPTATAQSFRPIIMYHRCLHVPRIHATPHRDLAARAFRLGAKHRVYTRRGTSDNSGGAMTKPTRRHHFTLLGRCSRPWTSPPSFSTTQ